MSEWQPIETAPVIDRDSNEEVPIQLVYGPEVGIQFGRAWRYIGGEPRATVFGYYGNWEITHWMPRPLPPKGEQ